MSTHDQSTLLPELSQPKSNRRPRAKRRTMRRVLVLDSSGETAAAFAAAELRDIEQVRVATVAQARIAMDQGEIDAAVVAADGEGDDAAHNVRELARGERPVVTVAVCRRRFEQAQAATLAGATAVVGRPLRPRELGEAIERALELAQQNKASARKARRLRRACRRLSKDKRDVARQVDLLCHDLIAGYQELAERVQELEEGKGDDFAAAVEGELDLEALIRKTLEHLIAKVGPCNAAVYLPATADEYSLAGYVNHDCAAEAAEMVLDHLADVLAPGMSDRTDPVHASDEAGLKALLGDDAAWLAGRQLVAATCWGKGEPLAVFALFRDDAEAFDAAAIESVRAVAAHLGPVLSRVVRVHHRAVIDPFEDWEGEGDCSFA